MNKRYVFNEIEGVKGLTDVITQRIFFFDGNKDFEDMADILNEYDERPLDLHIDFKEWGDIIDRLKINEAELIHLKETFNQLSEKIISETDFKQLYGKNNETIRKNHVNNELSDMVEQINMLKLAINHDNRQLNFIKALVHMKLELLKYL